MAGYDALLKAATALQPAHLGNKPAGISTTAVSANAAANSSRSSNNSSSSPTPEELLTVPRFDGTSDGQIWLNIFDDIASIFRWSEAACLTVAKVRLKGRAQRWAMSHTFTDWQDFKLQFLKRFGEEQLTVIARLENCYQLPGESPKQFADRFLADADKAGRTEDAALVLQFLHKLDPSLRLEVARIRPDSIDAAVEFCEYWIRHKEATTPTSTNKDTGFEGDAVCYLLGPAVRQGSCDGSSCDTGDESDSSEFSGDVSELQGRGDGGHNWVSVPPFRYDHGEDEDEDDVEDEDCASE
jgi:hypothetical protein